MKGCLRRNCCVALWIGLLTLGIAACRELPAEPTEQEPPIDDSAALWDFRGLRTSRVRALAFVNSRTLLSATDTGLYRSADGGQGWSRVDLDGSEEVLAVAAGSVGAFAATRSAVYLSRGNEPWSPVLQRGDIRTLLVTAMEMVLAGANNGDLLRSTDGGLNWSEVGSGLPQTTIHVLARRARILYAGLDGAGVYRSMDEGENWEPYGLGGHVVHDLAFLSNGVLFAATSQRVYRLPNGGTSWSFVGPNESAADIVYTLAVTSANGLFAGTAGGGVFRSSTAGESWRPFNDDRIDEDVFALVVDPVGFVYAGTNDRGVLRTLEPVP